MFFYYFCGNFVFGLTLTNILYVFVDRPFYAFMTLSFAKERAAADPKSNIEEFKQGVILGTAANLPDRSIKQRNSDAEIQ